MTSTLRIPKAEITGIYGYLLKRFSRKLLGDVPEPAEVMWHNRAVLSDYSVFGRKSQKWDRLDANLKSYAHMAWRPTSSSLPTAVGSPPLRAVRSRARHGWLAS